MGLLEKAARIHGSSSSASLSSGLLKKAMQYQKGDMSIAPSGIEYSVEDEKKNY